MEHERVREMSVLRIAQIFDVKQLTHGHTFSEEFFRKLLQPTGSVELKPQQEPRDTPPPIIYDDEFGKATVRFSRLRRARGFTVPVFAISYQEEGQIESDLTALMHDGFYFAWNDFAGFSTLSTLGDPVVFFNHRLLSLSRNFLFALGHEMGHTWQGDIERDFWRLLTFEDHVSQQRLKARYPTLGEYIKDIVLIDRIASSDYAKERRELGSQIKNVGPDGFNPRSIDEDLPELVSDVLARFNEKDAPLGPSHAPGFFNWVRANIPALYSIFDPMGEKLAWEFAFRLEQEEKINSGFHTPEEQTLFMLRGLNTYDKAYGVNNYTRWLTERKNS